MEDVGYPLLPNPRAEFLLHVLCKPGRCKKPGFQASVNHGNSADDDILDIPAGGTNKLRRFQQIEQPLRMMEVANETDFQRSRTSASSFDCIAWSGFSSFFGVNEF